MGSEAAAAAGVKEKVLLWKEIKRGSDNSSRF